MSEPDRDADARRLASEAYARGEPAGWFEPLYSAAADGQAIVPWDRDTANPQLREWFGAKNGTGLRAVVVGCGLGRDAEFVAGIGYTTTGFDLSRTAIAGARERYPDSSVSYEVADLLQLPDHYVGAFDLVVESYTVQSLPEPPRSAAITAVTTLVADGGTLLVIAAAGDVENPYGPPFPLTRGEIDAFAVDGIDLDVLEDIADDAGTRRWRASFIRARR